MVIQAKVSGDRKFTEFPTIKALYEKCRAKKVYDKTYRSFCYEVAKGNEIPKVKLA